MTQETKLGVFVLVSLAALAVSIILLGDFQFRSTYTLNILFNDIAGLPAKAKVKIAGVEVGAVKAITLEGTRALVKVWIREEVKIHTDAQADIAATGIIGSKYLELTLGSPGKPFLKDGDTIIGNDSVSLNKLAENVMKQLDKIAKAFEMPEGAAIGENLATTMSNLRKITDSLRSALAEQQDKLVNIVDNINNFTDDLAEITRDNKAEMKIAIKNISEVSGKLDRIMAKVENGEGTIGKLVSDKQMGNDLKETFSDLKETTKQAKQVMRRLNLIETQWDYTLRYDAKYDTRRHDVGLRIIPRPGKFYYVGGSNLGENTVYGTPDIEELNTFNLLVGRHFGPAQVYAGVIRSKGGIGAKLKPFWKWNPLSRLELTAEGYNFFRERPIARPKINVGARTQISEWAAVGAQFEDLYYSTNLNVYMNLSFRDDDIAYILGLVGLARP
jgi:phospholipid/cholesterol/gamma-HCH transport system substrate-binding protein